MPGLPLLLQTLFWKGQQKKMLQLKKVLDLMLLWLGGGWGQGDTWSVIVLKRHYTIR